MFCPKCGAYNDNENLWCVKCGYSLKSIPQEMKRERAGETVQNSGAQSYGGSVKPKKVRDYLVPAILVAAFCSVAFGIASVIFSGMTRAEFEGGVREKAESYSSKTKMFCFLGLAVGVVKWLAAIIFFIVAVIGSRGYYYPYMF